MRLLLAERRAFLLGDQLEPLGDDDESAMARHQNHQEEAVRAGGDDGTFLTAPAPSAAA